MVERCGDRQRKFNGLEKWPFRLFIEALPIMLQIALLLLACGLSRYIWSINAPVACVVISFTVLGILFYIGIVIAGTSSYECPFQTPASTALRYFRDNGGPWKFAGLSPSNVISFIHATLVNTWRGLVLASRHVRNIRSPLSWEISVSGVVSGIRRMPAKVGHQAIVLLLRIDRVFGNMKHRLARGIQSFRRRLVRGIRNFRPPALLPVTAGDMQLHPRGRRNGTGVRIIARNIDALRKQNLDNAHCVCWVLRNITDPEAIDSAIRLAGTIQWFDGEVDVDPPFDFIVSIFKACFDSTKKLYPGLRDRAYFSARAILQINTGARAEFYRRGSDYPIPTVPSKPSQHADPDLHNILHMLELNTDLNRPAIDFPRVGENTPPHLLWMSNLFVDLTRVGSNPILKSYESYLSAATANHQAVVANTLLVWCTLLDGRIEEETFWAVDKSYVIVSPFLSAHSMLAHQ